MFEAVRGVCVCVCSDAVMADPSGRQLVMMDGGLVVMVGTDYLLVLSVTARLLLFARA